MEHGCIVCHSFRPEANLRVRLLTRVSFGEHTVVLCEAHRRIAENFGVTSFEALRELYGESRGNRSYVPRRTHGHVPMPAVDRRERGRRSTDV